MLLIMGEIYVCKYGDRYAAQAEGVQHWPLFILKSDIYGAYCHQRRDIHSVMPRNCMFIPQKMAVLLS